MEKRTLGDLMNQGIILDRTGFPCGAHNSAGSGLPHIRPFNVSTEGDISLDQIKYIPAEKAEGKPQVQKGDILFNNTNTKELVGKCAKWDADAQVFSNHMTCIRLHNNSCDSDFISYAILHHWMTGKSKRLARAHVAQASIMGARFSEIEIPWFSKSDQRAIGQALRHVRDIANFESKQLGITQELKHAAMRALFTRGLHGEPQKQTEIGPMPESWEIITVGEAVNPFRFERAKQVPKSDYRLKGRWEVIDQGKDFICGYTNDKIKVIQLEDPLIIFGDHTRVFKYIDFECALGADGTKPLLAKREFFPKFLYYALTNLDIPSRGYNRHYSILKQMQIGKPTADEQHRIAAIIDTIDRKINRHRRKRAVLDDLFKTLLHKLMTSEIRVANLGHSVLDSDGPKIDSIW